MVKMRYPNKAVLTTGDPRYRVTGLLPSHRQFSPLAGSWTWQMKPSSKPNKHQTAKQGKVRSSRLIACCHSNLFLVHTDI